MTKIPILISVEIGDQNTTPESFSNPIVLDDDKDLEGSFSEDLTLELGTGHSNSKKVIQTFDLNFTTGVPSLGESFPNNFILKYNPLFKSNAKNYFVVEYYKGSFTMSGLFIDGIAVSSATTATEELSLSSLTITNTNPTLLASVFSAAVNINSTTGLSLNGTSSVITGIESGNDSTEPVLQLNQAPLPGEVIELVVGTGHEISLLSNSQISLDEDSYPVTNQVQSSVNNAFETTWAIPTDNHSLTLPIFNSSGVFVNCSIDWGDGTTIETVTTESPSHSYSTAGNYTISITPITTNGIPWFRINNDASIRDLIISIDNWGSNEWGSQVENSGLSQAFRGCSNLVTYNATDIPDITNNTSLDSTFRDTLLNVDFTGWDFSNVELLRVMLWGNTAFNNNSLNALDYSSVTDMQFMLYGATNANPDLTNGGTRNQSNHPTEPDSSFESITGTGADRWIGNGATLSTSNYDNLLIYLDGQNLQSGSEWETEAVYTNAVSGTARTSLVSKGIIINDNGSI